MEGNVISFSREAKCIAIVGIVVGLCVPFSITLFSHRDISLSIRHKLDLLKLHASYDHGVIALPGAKQLFCIEHIAIAADV